MKTSKAFTLTGAAVWLTVVPSALWGARETLIQESFEDASNEYIATPANIPGPGAVPQGTYVVIAHGDDGANAYVARRQVGSPGSRGVFGGTIDGEWFYAFNDIDGAPGDRGAAFPGEDLGNRQGRLKFHNIDVSGKGEMRLTLALAIGDSGPEPDNDLWIRVRFDGGDWFDVGGFKASHSNGRMIYYTGPRDTMTVLQDPNKLFREFTDWSWDIIGNGQIMDIDITYDTNHFLENVYVDNVRVTGENNIRFLSASFATDLLTEPESGSLPNALTLTLDQPAPAGGVTFAVSGQARVLNSLSGLPDSVTIPAGESSLVLPVEVIQDGRFTGTKIVDIFFKARGYNTAVARTRVENVTPKPLITITEVMNVVPGLPTDGIEVWQKADANGDGDRSNSTDDTFIEIVNWGDEPVDINNWRIGDDLADRHLIGWDKDVVLYPRTAYVVFSNSVDRPRGQFGGAIVELASGGGNGLALNITSREETPYLSAEFGAQVDLVRVPLQRADHLAITEALPEDHPGYALSAAVHTLVKGPAEASRVYGAEAIHTLIEGSGFRFFSPGTWLDGTPYFDVENEIALSIDQAVIREDAGANAATGTITLTSPAPAGGLEVVLETNGVIKSADGISPREVDLDSLVVMIPEGATSAQFRIGAFDDGVLDGDKVISFEGRAGPYVLPGFADVVVQDIAESDFNLVINEFLNDAVGAGEDYNLDGEGGSVSDQFVEVVNLTGRPVNLSGWRLEWQTTGVFGVPRPMHWFPKGTWIPDGGAIVVFSAIAPDKVNDPSFGGAIVQEAKTEDGSFKPDRLDFQITEDIADSTWSIRLFNQHGFLVHSHEDLETIAATQDQALTMAPDTTGEVALHFDQSLAVGQFFSASPGMKIDGTPFAGNGLIRLPQTFVEVAYADSDGWFWDPAFGWLASGMGLPYEMPWLYNLQLDTFWYVDPSSRVNSIWIYDLEMREWLFTTYSLFPWVSVYSTGVWMRHE